MTAEEPEISQGESASVGANTAGDEERWLTYLHYDLAVQQAVRRLGALSNENVEAFRALLLKGRDRSRIKDYEAESIRGLQGEAFVGDEELQRTLIVLNAEDPRLGEEFKKLVAGTGRPANLDQAVASLRAPDQAATVPETRKVVPITARREATASAPLRSAEPTQPHEAPAAPEPATLVAMAAPREAEPAPLRSAEPSEPRSKRLAVVAAVVGIAVIGFAAFQLIPRGAPPAPPAATAARVAVAAPRAVVPPTQPAMPAQDDERKSSPAELRPADNQPEKLAEPEKLPESTDGSSMEHPMSKPVPGSYYRAVRGDMLTRIALVAYNDPHKFVVIQKANPILRNAPNLVLVDQVIYIPPL